MKKLHLILSCLLAIGICSCCDSTPDYSEAEREVAKATVARVQKSDSLDFYIGYYTQAEDRKFIGRLNGLILDNMGNADFNVETLAEKMHSSTSKLYRHIRALTGYSTQSYILRLRMERAKELLATTNLSVSDVAMRCGFDDAAYFTRVFRSFHGCTPSQMKKN